MYTHAIGLGGVIYGSNPFVLRKHSIKRKDLKTIRGGVLAAAIMLHKKIKQCRGNLHCALRRYYGAGSRYPKEVIRKSIKYKRILDVDQ
jgi:hypothetical protein